MVPGDTIDVNMNTRGLNNRTWNILRAHPLIVVALLTAQCFVKVVSTPSLYENIAPSAISGVFVRKLVFFVRCRHLVNSCAMRRPTFITFHTYR